MWLEMFKCYGLCEWIFSGGVLLLPAIVTAACEGEKLSLFRKQESVERPNVHVSPLSRLDAGWQPTGMPMFFGQLQFVTTLLFTFFWVRSLNLGDLEYLHLKH
jgi:hypothetical protein